MPRPIDLSASRAADRTADRAGTADATPAAVGARIVPGLERHFGLPGPWRFRIVEAKARGAAWPKLILHATHPASGTECCVKTGPSRLRILSEYRALQALRRLTPDAIGPRFIDRFARFAVLDWIDAPLLLDLLPGPDRALWLTRAGRWLRALHDAPARPPLLRPRLPILRPPRPLPDEPADSPLPGLRRRLEGLDLSAGPKAVLHGDAYARNFFASGDRLIAFDRERALWGLTHFDVAKLLVDLATRRARDAHDGRPWGGDDEADRRAFFAGYGPLPADSLALYDLVEDLLLSAGWRRGSKNAAEVLHDDMARRGLLPGTAPPTRPGRLVAGPGGTGWSTAPG